MVPHLLILAATGAAAAAAPAFAQEDTGRARPGPRPAIPRTIVAEAVRIFSYDIDFQRDVIPGDTFTVLFTRPARRSWRRSRGQRLLYAALRRKSGTLELYRFMPWGAAAGYFDRRGRSARKALLRTPVDGATITSRHGRRRHPVLGYTKVHRGIDFAAPHGTRVVAASDGVVQRARWQRGHGRYLRIRHDGSYATGYAHLSRYAWGIHHGVRVRQGQTIGYVGATGNATGPHLHYEVFVDGRAIDPMKLRQKVGTRLTGPNLARFQRHRADIDGHIAGLIRHGRRRKTTYRGVRAVDHSRNGAQLVRIRLLAGEGISPATARIPGREAETVERHPLPDHRPDKPRP